MRKGLIKLGQTALSPKPGALGVSLYAPNSTVSLSAGAPLTVYGSCLINKEELSSDKRDLISGLILTGIEQHNQTPRSLNLIGDQAIFDDDIIDAGSHYLAFFECDIIEFFQLQNSPVSLYLHAANHQYVSNVLAVRVLP